jgi:hypothetical protein
VGLTGPRQTDKIKSSMWAQGLELPIKGVGAKKRKKKREKREYSSFRPTNFSMHNLPGNTAQYIPSHFYYGPNLYLLHVSITESDNGTR